MVEPSESKFNESGIKWSKSKEEKLYLINLLLGQIPPKAAGHAANL